MHITDTNRHITSFIKLDIEILFIYYTCEKLVGLVEPILSFFYFYF